MSAVDTIRVLYVEDDPADQALTRRHLGRHAPHLKLQIVSTIADGLAALEAGTADLLLSDFRLPDGTGLDLVKEVKARGLAVPVVLVTGSGSADAAVRLLKAGATDYVIKREGYLETLPGVIEGALHWFRTTREVWEAPVRVLYAEDDPAEVELARRAFAEHGWPLRLDVAARAQDALQRLREVPYDVLLLDYRLPDLSGIEVLKILRDEGRRIPVVMVTGKGDEGTAVEAFKLGVADYVIKREGYFAKLPSALENVLHRQRLTEEKDALVVLNGVTRALARLGPLPELVQRVTGAARQLLRADWSVLWLAAGDRLAPAAWDGLEESEARALELRIVQRADEDGGAAERRVELSGSRAATLAVPLETAALMIGVLAVGSVGPREFRSTETRLLGILGDHAAVSLENARLYQELHDRFEELQRTQAHLVQTEKVAAMGQLLAGVAHELNNPLSVVTGRAALLRIQLGEGPQARMVEQLDQAARRCGRIVSNFLALARQRPPERQMFSLNQIAREAVELLAYQLRVDEVEVVLDLADDVPPLWGDPHQLHQVLVNLISNAHQAMGASSHPRRLTITSRLNTAAGRVELAVADSGPGIPPDILPRIFEPFFTTKPPGLGTGLGLPLCQGIVEQHGGAIRVQSEPGQGATFIVELPLAAPPLTSAATAGPPAPVHGARILVIDDDPDVGGVLADLLEADGHLVDMVTDGVQALERLRAHPYEVVFSDARMPRLDGPGLYAHVREHRPDLLPRIVLVTGDTLSPPIQDFLTRTAVPCLGKPYVIDDIRQVIRRVLEGA